MSPQWNEFYEMVPDLYGDKTCTYIMHQLNHVANYVRLLGHTGNWTELANSVQLPVWWWDFDFLRDI